MVRSTASTVDREPVCAPRTVTTLLDLVSELTDAGATESEVVAAVVDLVESGRVRLIGQICDEHLLADPCAAEDRVVRSLRCDRSDRENALTLVGRRRSSRSRKLPSWSSTPRLDSTPVSG